MMKTVPIYTHIDTHADSRIHISRRLLQSLLIALLWLFANQSYASADQDANQENANTNNTNPEVTNVHIEAWLHQYVMPSYVALHQANLNLQGQAHKLCDQVSQQTLDDIQPYLSEALQALAYSQAIDGGPMQGQLRNFHLYFWPDRTNLVSKQLAKLLSEADFKVLEEQGLSDASVALTGYTALERLLYTPSYRQLIIEQQQSFACQYIVAVSDNLVRLTAEITDAWQTSWYQQLLKPGNNNSLFKNKAHQVSFVFSNIDVLLSKIITKKLAKPLASSASSAKPKRLESWRSGHTLLMLKANVRALTDSLNLILKPALVKAGEALLWAQIENDLSLMQQQLDLLPTPLVAHLNEPQHWQATQQLQTQFIQLQTRLKQIHPRIDVQLGFNAYDGD
jgi:predicted lipoprotein